MSRPREKWARCALCFCVTCLMALGLGMPLLSGTGLAFALPRYGLYCAGIALALSLLRLRPRAALYACGVFFLSQAALWLAGRGFLRDTLLLIRASALWFGGAEVVGALYADVFCLQLAVYATLLCAALADPDNGPYLPMTAAAMLFTLMWLLGLRGQSAYMLPVLPAILLMLAWSHTHESELPAARKSRRALYALPAALLLAAMAFLIAPPEGTKVQPLSAAADRLRQTLEDYFFFQEQRARFTLEADGFMPQGEERLGGAASPSERLVMRVETAQNVYLRGAVLDAYTGAAWYDSVSAQRYGWHSLRYRSLRDRLLETSYPLAGDAVPEQTVQVTLMSEGASTLFTPQRVRALRVGEGMVPYFNLGSELFITRNLRADDAYSVDYISMNALDAGMPALAAQGEAADDPEYADIAAQYLALPGHLQRELYDLAARETAAQGDALHKALALRAYLRANFAYALDVQTPPADVDFVAWFLLAEKRGYCTYFASAMTVLCRMAGIPARYVEGYTVRPGDTGMAFVYGTDAHAWTEIYLRGVGWVTIDATPSRDDSDQMPEQGGGALSPSPSPAAPTATPTPPPQDQDTPTPTPSNQPDSSDSPTDTPSPAPNDAPAPTPPPDNDSNADDGPRLPWLWLLLLLAALLLLAWRARVTEPVYRAARVKNDDQALLIYYSALRDCAARLGVRPNAAETPLDYALRAGEALGMELAPVAEAVGNVCYGRHPAPPQAVRQAKACYIALRERLSVWQKVILLLRRMPPARRARA